MYERRCRRIGADCLGQRLPCSIEDAPKAIQLVAKPNAQEHQSGTQMLDQVGLTDPRIHLKTYSRNDTLPSAS
jgi:hypothetical protein